MSGTNVEFHCDAKEGTRISPDYLAFPISVFFDSDGKRADLSPIRGSTYATALYVDDVVQDPYTHQFNRDTETLLILGETFQPHARVRLVFKL